MKNMGIVLTAFISSLFFLSEGQAGIVVLGPKITFSSQQPVEAIIVDGSGATYEKQFYYNPSLGGIDLGTSFGGNNTSVYFPNYNVRYLWYNNQWVNEEGYYWDHGHHVYLNHPHWNVYWTGYWTHHWHDSWHNHWQKHHDEVAWHYREHEHWHEHWHHH